MSLSKGGRSRRLKNGRSCGFVFVLGKRGNGSLKRQENEILTTNHHFTPETLTTTSSSKKKRHFSVNFVENQFSVNFVEKNYSVNFAEKTISVNFVGKQLLVNFVKIEFRSISSKYNFCEFRRNFFSVNFVEIILSQFYCNASRYI
jgi:hypothetical protein